MSEFVNIEGINEDLKEYAITNYELVKLQATKRISLIGSELISTVIIALFGLFFLLILSCGVGFYLSSLIGNTFSGFFIVAGFYLLVTLIVFLYRKKILEIPLRDKIVTKLLEDR